MTMHKFASAVGEMSATITTVKEELIKTQARLMVLGDFLSKAETSMKEALDELGIPERKEDAQDHESK